MGFPYEQLAVPPPTHADAWAQFDNYLQRSQVLAAALMPGVPLIAQVGFAEQAHAHMARGAALALPDTSPWLIGAYGVVLAQLLQTLLLGSFLLLRQPGALISIANAWKLSSVAGTLGALASIGWLTAAALRPAADVRTLGLVEVLFSYLVSSRLFSERLSPGELLGLALVSAGLVLICLQL